MTWFCYKLNFAINLTWYFKWILHTNIAATSCVCPGTCLVSEEGQRSSGPVLQNVMDPNPPGTEPGPDGLDLLLSQLMQMKRSLHPCSPSVSLAHQTGGAACPWVGSWRGGGGLQWARLTGFCASAPRRWLCGWWGCSARSCGSAWST